MVNESKKTFKNSTITKNDEGEFIATEFDSKGIEITTTNLTKAFESVANSLLNEEHVTFVIHGKREDK